MRFRQFIKTDVVKLYFGDYKANLKKLNQPMKYIGRPERVRFDELFFIVLS